MATYTVTAGHIAAHDKTLVTSTVDTVTFQGTGAGDVFEGTPTGAATQVEVMTDGTAAVYFTTDGSTPTVSGANTYKIPASGGVSAMAVAPLVNNGDIVVQLISAGTPVYDVSIA